MSEHVMVSTPLFHQRSHSMPVGHAFINNNNNTIHGEENNNNNTRAFDYKRPSPLKNDLSESFPLPIPKSLATQMQGTPINIPTSKPISLEGEEEEPRFFCHSKSVLDLFVYNGKSTTGCPVVFGCKMDRGFFVSQSHWTCYRRNYFQVTASLIIPGHTEGTCYGVQTSSDKQIQPVQQFLVRLKACTSNTPPSTTSSTEEDTVLENHNVIRPVALTQMTAKRDKGPQREPPVIAINPFENVYGSEQASVTFERLQFRVATANNGKRRASQQYFRLIFELVAQLDDLTQHVISECQSSPLVVRGRSPGHYSAEPHSQPSKQQSSTMDTVSKKKRKVTSPTTEPLPVKPVEYSNGAEKDNFTLPPPHYVYAPPPMVVEHNDDQSTNPSTTSSMPTSSSSYSMMSVLTPASYAQQQHPSNNSAFSNFHNRSQSANDSAFFARHRQQQQMKYQPSMIHEQQQQQQHNNEGMFDSYETGMARALKNWQQQVVHQRNDSSATYDSYDNGQHHSTRPGTPIPYHHGEVYQQQSQTQPNNWPQQHHHFDKSTTGHDKLQSRAETDMYPLN